MSLLKTALSQLRRLIATPPATNTQAPYLKARNVVTDILAEGRRKNTIQLLLEVDATAMAAQIEKRTALGQKISITSYIAHTLAASVAAEPHTHAYRHKRRELILFKDVDLAVMVEREVDGAPMPLPYVVRGANQKTPEAIHAELSQAKTAALHADGPLSALEATFFAQPRWLRKIVWYFARNDAHLFRELAGTVGLTSMGMHGSGRAVVIPITPMTLTLSVGAISPQPVVVDGTIVVHEVLQLNLSADHDIIDGAPLMRFAARLKQNLETGCG